MRALVLLPALLALIATPALAQSHKPAPAKPATKPAAASPPKSLTRFDDWSTATHQESGVTVCYAYTRAETSLPAVANRGEVNLTVAQRPGARDTVAISAGFAYSPGATVTMQVDLTSHDFYTAGHNAFARDGKAAVAAFNKGSRAIARSPGPHDTAVTDTFSLKGFSAAYAATVKLCPAK
jgi:ribosomal protein L31